MGLVPGFEPSHFHIRCKLQLSSGGILKYLSCYYIFWMFCAVCLYGALPICPYWSFNLIEFFLAMVKCELLLYALHTIIIWEFMSTFVSLNLLLLTSVCSFMVVHCACHLKRVVAYFTFNLTFVLSLAMFFFVGPCWTHVIDSFSIFSTYTVWFLVMDIHMASYFIITSVRFFVLTTFDCVCCR